jgi:hypothetical protein
MKRLATWSTVLVLAAACGGGLATLPGGPKPAWVGAKGHTPGYPDENFLTGSGMWMVQGKDLTAAQQAVDAAARVDLTKKIEVSVTSEFQSYQSEEQKNGATKSEQSVSELTREAVQGFELEGVEIKERWLDESAGVAYALAVWPKVRAEALLKAKLSEVETQARKAEEEGDRAASTSPGTALRQYLAARAMLDRGQKNAVLLRAVTGQAAGVPDASAVRGKLDKLLESIDVKVNEGDGQRVKPNSALPRPLVVKATVGGNPLAGLPLRFELAGGKVDAGSDTDAAGLAQARVSDVGALAAGEGRIVGRVDWAKLAGTSPAPGFVGALRPFEVGFTVMSRSLASTRVLVKIIESIENESSETLGAVQSAVTNRFTEAGFAVRDAEALVKRIPAEQLLTLDPKAFQKEARDLADVVVVGQAVSAFSSTLSGDVVIHRARLQLRVVDLGTGEVLATLAIEKKGAPAQGAAKAGKKALDALAASFNGDIPSQVKTKLEL